LRQAMQEVRRLEARCANALARDEVVRVLRKVRALHRRTARDCGSEDPDYDRYMIRAAVCDEIAVALGLALDKAATPTKVDQ
jgi:hypothetical protein